MDFQTGKLSEADHKALDRQLRAEAMEVLRAIDEETAFSGVDAEGETACGVVFAEGLRCRRVGWSALATWRASCPSSRSSWRSSSSSSSSCTPGKDAGL